MLTLSSNKVALLQEKISSQLIEIIVAMTVSRVALDCTCPSRNHTLPNLALARKLTAASFCRRNRATISRLPSRWPGPSPRGQVLQKPPSTRCLNGSRKLQMSLSLCPTPSQCLILLPNLSLMKKNRYQNLSQIHNQQMRPQKRKQNLRKSQMIQISSLLMMVTKKMKQLSSPMKTQAEKAQARIKVQMETLTRLKTILM